MRYEERAYRNRFDRSRPFFRVVVKETDLYISMTPPLEDLARELIIEHRGYIESYIARFPDFAGAMKPWRRTDPAPRIIQEMVDAGKAAGVGPMAAVAGVMAESVGKGLLKHSQEVIVENGGDVFLKTDAPLTTAIYAGTSPLSLKVGLRIDPSQNPVAVCTSSGTIGHSKSFGKADAVCVVSGNCALADAVATAVGNRVRRVSDIADAVNFGKGVEGVTGLVVIMKDKIGFGGGLEVVPVR